ncbi:MAG: hypothetical protein ABII19_03150 [Patescibacteria group bacterium]
MLNRLLPIITPILIFFSLELFFFKPTFIYFIFILLILAIGGATWKIIGKGLIDVAARWLYLLTPLAFLTSGVMFLTLLERAWAFHLLAFALATFCGVFLENIFVYIYQHAKYQANSLENISNYLNLAAMFLFNASLFGFSVFLNVALWKLSLISFVFTFILTFQTIWINKINLRAAPLQISTLCLVLFELFWAVSFLPTAFYVNGLIIAISFYLMNNLMRLHLLGSLNKKIVRRYFVICGAIIFLVLITAQWI